MSKVCMIDDCGGVAISRGLCSRCYATFSREIKRGRASWGALERGGLCLPRHTPVRVAISPARIALEKLNERA